MVTPPPPRPVAFAIGDNVFAKWKPKKWYLAHIINIKDGMYDVYFVGDGQIKKGLKPNQVRIPPTNLTLFKRKDMLNAEFYDDGDDDLASGTWKVRRIIEVDNTFTCVRLTDGDAMSKNCEQFDIGYVFRTVQRARERVREQGPQ